MYRLLILIFSVLLAAPSAMSAPAAAHEWRQAPEYDVLLSSYDISPEVLHLKAGEAVRLRFVNNSERVLDFSAPSFFRTAELRRRDLKDVAGGGLRLGPGQTRTVALVPKAGRYRMRSGNFLHRVLGMSGVIIVE